MARFGCVIAGLLGLGVGLGLASAQAQAQWFTDKQSIMGTEIALTFWTEKADEGPPVIKAVMDDMRWMEQTFSPYIETSELYKVNATAAKAPVKISPELSLLIDKSLHYSEYSDGAFDITFASVGWYYDYRAHQKPSDNEIKRLLPAINYHFLKLDKTRGELSYGHPNIRIDLGGIAKGYAVDRAAEILQRMGIHHATVSAGGDSRLLGDKLGQPWMVGIKNPRPTSKQDAVITLLPLADSAISTSGDYERFFFDQKSGERIHHILNPKTGKSASEVMSVTILGPKGLDTDPLTKCVWISGVKKGLALINSLPDFDAVIIDKNGKVFYSKGLTPPSAQPTP